MQLGELGAGLDAELVDQRVPGAGEGAEGVGLAAVAVQSEREQRPAVLAQRRLGHSGLGQTDEVAVLTEVHATLDEPLLGGLAGLVQASRLGDGRRPGVEGIEGNAAPQVQGIGEGDGGAIVLLVDRVGARSLDERLEAANIEPVVREFQAVPARRGLDHVGPELSPKTQDASLHDLGPRRWRVATPERVGQALGGQRLAGPNGERQEHHEVAPPQRHLVAVDAQRAEQVEAHAASVRTGTTECQRP